METAPLKMISFLWGVPFISFLMALAVVPLFFQDFWHKNLGKIVVGFSLLIIVPMLFFLSSESAQKILFHTLAHNYLPFTILIATLFILSGGIHITTKGKITPFGNVLFLLLGSFLSSFMGTTGASILLIRPFLMMNGQRYHKHYLVIFFIFTISNIGGCLSPIGDPPLFLGFLNGISFFWPFKCLFQPFVYVMFFLLCVFYMIDRFYCRGKDFRDEVIDLPEKVKIYGKRNFLGIILVICALIFSSLDIPYIHLMTNVMLILIAVASWVLTPKMVHHMNRFSFEPLREVSLVFLAIFITLIPIEAMLHLGKEGPLHMIATLANPQNYPDPLRYYFLTGILSSFLDNAPTYLLFFHMLDGIIGGGPAALMTTHALTLTALSLGSVFFGALTYIGNAPNLMVKAMAEHLHVKMPGFIGYMLWSLGILFPILALFGLYSFR